MGHGNNSPLATVHDLVTHCFCSACLAMKLFASILCLGNLAALWWLPTFLFLFALDVLNSATAHTYTWYKYNLFFVKSRVFHHHDATWNDPTILFAPKRRLRSCTFGAQTYALLGGKYKAWRPKNQTGNYKIWLVVSTPLKNISQLGWLSPIYGKKCSKPQTRDSLWMCLRYQHKFRLWSLGWIRWILWLHKGDQNQ